MTLSNVYVGCFTEDIWNHYARPQWDTTIPSKGVEWFKFEHLTGSLRPQGSVGGDLFSPQYLALHPTLPVLYAAEFTHPARLSSFSILSNGQLERQHAIETQGSMASAVAVHPLGSFAYVSHLGDGALTACSLDGRGMATQAEVVTASAWPDSLHQQAKGMFAYEGFGSRYHQVRVTPDGAGLVLADVGTDALVTHPIDPDGRPSRRPISRIALPRGSAPRHVAFHPSGNVVYAVGERDGTLYALEMRGWVPRRISSSHPLAPREYQGTALPTELCFHDESSTLFVAVRGPDCIATLAIDDSGTPSTVHHEPSRGRDPRTVALDPTGKYLLVGNWRSNTICVFAIEESGRLRFLGKPIEVPSPSSIAFAPASSTQT